MKQSSVPWDPWLAKLSDEAIPEHWARHPSDDVGVILGEGQLVLDTDSPESTAALLELEQRHGVEPQLIVSTRRGEHHYFVLRKGVFVRSDSHSSKLQPERIDVKAGPRSMVNLPPSGVRTVKYCFVQHVGQLTEVDQAFVDDVFRHNGRPPPRPSPERTLLPVKLDDEKHDERIARLKPVVEAISPNVGYDVWSTVGMAIAYETGGSEAGRDLYDAWSSGGHTYPGPDAIDRKWKSFDPAHPNPVRIGSLIDLARQAGADVAQLMGDAFEVLSTPTEIVRPEPQPLMATAVRTPLDRYSLRGRLDELRRNMVETVPLLGRIALAGQSTVIFAGPGTGKTVLTLHLALECQRLNRIPGLRIYYINEDDDSKGLAVKGTIFEEFEGFHLITEGQFSFKASDLEDILVQMADDGSARLSVIIMDTMKKVVDPMDKKDCRRFMKKVRKFCAKGGTFIGLAHVNKNPDGYGNPIAAGTSDIRDDADCTYILSDMDGGGATGEKFVLFRNTKRRGNNALDVAYAYALEDDIEYADLLLSVREIEPYLLPSRQAAKPTPEAAVIEFIRTCLAEGINTKMKLATEVGKRAGISRRDAGDIIDRYTGDDPLMHHWFFTVGGRGAHVYRLLERPPADPSEEPEG